MLLSWLPAVYSLEGFVFGAEVEVDAASLDDERVAAVILDQHVCVVLRPQLDEGLNNKQHAQPRNSRLV